MDGWDNRLTQWPTILVHISNLIEILHYCNSITGHQIITNICWGHDSAVIMSFAKSGHNYFVGIWKKKTSIKFEWWWKNVNDNEDIWSSVVCFLIGSDSGLVMLFITWTNADLWANEQTSVEVQCKYTNFHPRKSIKNIATHMSILTQFTKWNYSLQDLYWTYLDSKVHGANMRPTWVLSAPDGPHVGPMNLAIRVFMTHLKVTPHYFTTSLHPEESLSHNKAKTKWPTFSRWHFQMHFLE